MDPLELFGREVLREIRERDEKNAAKKAALVARVSDKAHDRCERVKQAGDHVVESTRGPLRAPA